MADPQQKEETSPGKLNPDDILQKKLSSDEQIKLYFKNQSSTSWRYIPLFIIFLTLSTNVSLFKAATTAAAAVAAVTAVSY